MYGLVDKNQQRIKELVEKIRSKEKKEKSSSSKPGSSQGITKLPTKPDKLRKIFVGWLHRTSKNSRFTQVRMKDGGSTRHLMYHESEADSITVDFLIKQASRLFFPEGKSKFGMLEDMDVELGNFAQEKIRKFKDTDGNECSFKEYLKNRGLFASKFYVYLMTTVIEDEDTPSKISQTEVCSPASSGSGSVSSLTCNEVAKLAVTSTPKKSVTVTENTVENQKQIFGPALGKDQPTLSTLETIREHCLGVTYEEVKESSYTAEVVVRTLSNSRKDCYDLSCFSEPLTLDLDINDYDSLEHGHSVTEIVKGGKYFLKREYTCIPCENDQESFEFSFPEADQKNMTGLILHPPSQVWGYDEDALVLGVVASCHMTPEAYYIWYRNEKIIKEGRTFCCITVNKPGVYNVEVQCGEERDMSAPIFVRLLNASHSTSGESYHATLSTMEQSSALDEKGNCAPLTVIDKEEIVFSNRDEIGQGSFGIVYKGSWAGTEVAIKHSKIRSAKRVWSAVQNEVQLHSMIRHPNIVQIMGVCLLKNSIYIVSEYIEGLNLDELLFGDNENSNSFDMINCDKLAIGRQLCQAVAYLHNLKPAVVHRDIKPANVLVAKGTHITKLCDMGLSKLKSHQSLSQTSSTGIPGTPHYMAPECLVGRKKATVHSDIWSLGCTLVELLSGQDCWEDVLKYSTSGMEDDDTTQSFFEALTTAMKNHASPRTLELGTAACDNLHQTIMNCFQYAVEKRPSAINIISVFQELDTVG